MPDVDRDALRTAAENATPGPWRAGRSTSGVAEVAAGPNAYLVAAMLTDAEATFIAAADPPTMLALLDENDRLLAALAAAEARAAVEHERAEEMTRLGGRQARRADRAEGAIREAKSELGRGFDPRNSSDRAYRILAAYREEAGRAPEWSDPKPGETDGPGWRYAEDPATGIFACRYNPRTREQYEKEQNA